MVTLIDLMGQLVTFIIATVWGVVEVPFASVIRNLLGAMLDALG